MFSLRRLAVAVLFVSLARAAWSASPELHLTADGHGSALRPLPHTWSFCVGAGRANEGLRAGWLEQLQLVHREAGFQYVRFHGLFHDDMFVYREAGGHPVYNFQYIDDLFDRMLAIGVRPFVELGFFPQAIAAPGSATQFWWKGNISPPADFAKWTALVRAFVEHCRARYGAAEVRRWYFEVWNEPNLPVFWGGTQAQYFELYATTVQAIKAIDAELAVGGPATSNFQVTRKPGEGEVAKTDRPGGPTGDDVEALDWEPVWISDFLAFCQRGHLPVDFVSTHPYPQDFPFDDGTGRTRRVRRGVDATHNDLTKLRRLVDASAYPEAKIHLTEWSSSPSSRDCTHDSLAVAAFLVKENLECAGLADSLSYWTFSDVFEEKGGGNTIFHGGFGLVNYQGIVKPAFHAYRMMNALGDDVLAQQPGVIATRQRGNGDLAVLAYNFPAEVRITPPVTSSLAAAQRLLETGSDRPLAISLTGLAPNATVRVETLDQTHGNATAAWEAMGAPEPPTREQAATLRRQARETQREVLHADAAGRFVLQRRLAPWSLLLVQTGATGDSSDRRAPAVSRAGD